MNIELLMLLMIINGSLTHGANELPGTFFQLGFQMCCDTGLLSAV